MSLPVCEVLAHPHAAFIALRKAWAEGMIAYLILGIPATLIPIYAYVRFARTPKGR